MLQLLKNCKLHNNLDETVDILIGSDKILAISSSSSGLRVAGCNELKEYDMNELILIPGFIDVHVHLTGGGGEDGPNSRTPSAQLSELVNAGVTTVIGMLGTDGTTRSLENLLCTVRAFNADGITAFMYTGSYEVPSPTICGSYQRDIINIEPCIGLGEIAISDHRSSWPTVNELARIVGDVRRGGMLSGKSGIVCFHVGAAMMGLKPLRDVLTSTSLPIGNMYPTHLNTRGEKLLLEAEEWLRMGGCADFTADEECAKIIAELEKKNVPMNHLSISSDAYGSKPAFSPQGELLSYSYAKPDLTYLVFRELVNIHGWSITSACQFFTCNPARILQPSLKHRGSLQVGNYADILAICPESLDVKYVWANGNLMKSPQYLAKGRFET